MGNPYLVLVISAFVLGSAVTAMLRHGVLAAVLLLVAVVAAILGILNDVASNTLSSYDVAAAVFVLGGIGILAVAFNAFVGSFSQGYNPSEQLQ